VSLRRNTMRAEKGSGMDKEFSRHLTNKAFARLREEPKLVALLQYCRADPSLSIFLRGTTIDVYWEGFVVFHVTLSSGRMRIGSERDEPLEGLPNSLDDWDPAHLPEHISWVKDLRADKAATKVPELRFESAVIRDNQAVGSPVMVLDRQVAGPGGKDQLDLMLLDVGSGRLGLAELKVARNREIGGSVLKQLQRYIAAFGELVPEYTKILTQTQELGLAANRHARITPGTAPIPIVMLAGLPVRKLGAPSDSALLHALRKQNSEIVAKDPLWAARLLVFPRHTEQCFTIPSSLEDLPTIQQWCDRNLIPQGTEAS
jgi:hypothetical protein